MALSAGRQHQSLCIASGGGGDVLVRQESAVKVRMYK